MALVVPMLRAFSSLTLRLRFQLCCQFHRSVTMSKEQIEELKKNPYFGKYADKIAKLQQSSPDEFVQRVSQNEKSKCEEAGGSDFSFPTKPKVSTKGMVKKKELNDILKLDLLADKSATEIGEIWTNHFAHKDSVSAIIPSETYSEMHERLKKYHTFLFPLPRQNGYEFIMMQFSGNVAHFTTLINYQAFQENAPECLTLVHYPELSKSKGVVLMVGEYDKNLLNIKEAQCLANQLEMFFCNPSPERQRLLETFNSKPGEFRHTDLIRQLENVSLEGNQKS